jgi:hypothetical protein
LGPKRGQPPKATHPVPHTRSQTQAAIQIRGNRPGKRRWPSTTPQFPSSVIHPCARWCISVARHADR